ncbi:MAG: hypothetical protein KIT10_06435 [Flavobacteriales bacterium]|nr:hypothetical protein [Flavobacteriales bacterium]
MKMLLRSLLLAILVGGSWGATALAAPPIGGPPPCWPPPCIPIDGGLTGLIVAGALLGGRHALALRRTRRKPEL